MNPPFPSDINRAIVDASLSGVPVDALLADICERLARSGIALLRASVASTLLDPTYDGHGVIWIRGVGSVKDAFTRAEFADNPAWTRSPFYALVEQRQPHLRRRLDASYRRGEFPLLDRFQDDGATDYVAFAQFAGGDVRAGETQGMVASWSTDARGGFSDTEVETLAQLMPTLTLAMMLQTATRTSRTLLATYLGTDAAERVLAGNIVRGQAEKLRAVIWFSDLVGFTRIADTASADHVLAMLNDYADAQVQAIEGGGGHVLKFLGDGILAMFPDADTARACGHALDAAASQRRRIAALNQTRMAAGLPATEVHVALHVGELLYGNIGSPRRLDFTVLGPAVNEAARIETLCGSLEQPLIVSAAFAEAAGDARARLVSLGRYAMKGVSRPQDLYTLEWHAELPPPPR